MKIKKLYYGLQHNHGLVAPQKGQIRLPGVFYVAGVFMASTRVNAAIGMAL
jgi:hypothetical protein